MLRQATPGLSSRRSSNTFRAGFSTMTATQGCLSAERLFLFTFFPHREAQRGGDDRRLKRIDDRPLQLDGARAETLEIGAAEIGPFQLGRTQVRAGQVAVRE